MAYNFGVDLGFDLGSVGDLLGGGGAPSAPAVESSPYSLFGGGPGPSLNLGFSPTDALSTGAPASGGLSGLWDTLSSGIGKGVDWLGSAAGKVSPLLQLGNAGLGAAAGIMGMQQGAQQNRIMNRAERGLNQAAAPAASAAAQLIPAGTAAMLGGPLPPGLQAQADQWKEGALGKYRDYFAKAGLTDSTMMATVESMVEQQYNVMKEQLAEQLLQGGYTGTATATGPLSSEGQMAATAMGGTAQTMASANKSLALLLGEKDRHA